jgi:SPP1 family predicted phage head-tail adaptor
MRAGLMTKIVSVYQTVTTTDEYNDRVTSWQPVIERVRCRVTYGNQGIAIENDEVIYKDTITFSLRYTGLVKEYMRIHWEDRKYRITGIKRIPERGELDINTELINE